MKLKKILAWLLLALLFLPGTAMAQGVDKTFNLESGGKRLWTILREEGCSKEETNKLWPQVAGDNGLDPAKQKVWQPRKNLVLKRDCSGELLELVRLRQQVDKLTRDLDQVNKTRQEELEKARQDERNKLAAEMAGKVSIYWWAIALLMLLPLAVGILSSYLIWGRRVSELQPAPSITTVTDPDTVNISREIHTRHWGEKRVARWTGRGWQCLGYEDRPCPTAALVYDEAEFQEHLKAEHKHEGHVGWLKGQEPPTEPEPPHERTRFMRTDKPKGDDR